MCRRVTCSKCGKPDWRGCGAHVEQVLGDVPKAERCRCRVESATHHGADAATAPRSWLSRLLGN